MSRSSDIRINGWTVVPNRNLLRSDERSIKLEPRAMDVLLYLVNHAGEVVSVDQLIADLWKGRITDDAVIYKRINQLRKALGDDPHSPRFIETIPKRGYRWLPAVETLAATPTTSSSEPERDPEVMPARPQFNWTFRWKPVSVLAGLVALSLTFVFAEFRTIRTTRPVPPTDDLRSLEMPLPSDELPYTADVPAQDMTAGDFYVLGERYMGRIPDRTWTPLAVQMYEKAIEKDPESALAWAALSRAHMVLYERGLTDDGEESLHEAERALERAFELAPDSPDTHIAMARYYKGIGEHEKALRELEIADEITKDDLPKNPYLLRMRATLQRKMGEIEPAVNDMSQAIELDPFNIEQLAWQAETLTFLRRYEEAERLLERILQIRPNMGSVYLDKNVWIPFVRGGDFKPSKKAFADPAAETASRDQRLWLCWLTAVYARNYPSALRFLEDWTITREDGAFRRFHVDLLRGVTYELARNPEAARIEFEKAREQIERALIDSPDDLVLAVAGARALAGLGDKKAAAKAIRDVFPLLPHLVHRDVLSRPSSRIMAITALVSSGEHEAAIEHLEDYLSKPGQRSLKSLLPDPRFDPIREHPRFQALLQTHL